MDKEFVQQLKMTYEEQCAYLQNKYGLPPRDYFVNDKCSTRPKENSKTKFGLMLHHNAEILGNVGNLGVKQIAQIYPFDWQKRENLSYCNLIEHLFLHLKINARESSDLKWAYDLDDFFSSSGFYMLVSQINDLFYNRGSNIELEQNYYAAIQNMFEDYCSLLRGIRCYLDMYYQGKKETVTVKGEHINLPVITAYGEKKAKRVCFFIDNVVDEKDEIVLRLDDEIIEFPYDIESLTTEQIKRYEDGFISVITSLSVSAPDYDGSEKMIDYGFDLLSPRNGNFEKSFKLWMKQRQIVWSLRDVKARLDYYTHRQKWFNLMCLLWKGEKWTFLEETLNKPYDEESKMIASIIKDQLVRCE